MKLKRFSKDHQTLFENIIFEHLDSLYSTSLRLTHNRQDAQDLVQDSCLKAYQNFQKFELGTNFKAWIFKILMNTFINKYHKDKRNPASVQYDKVEYALEDDNKPKIPVDSILDDHEKFHQLFDDEIVSAIEALPEDYRTCVLLCDIENFSYKEIGDILNIPIGTVMSRISRGRKMLQKSLFDYAKEKGYIKE